MTHLDKLKELIKTGDSASINQALELAGVLFEKGSKEMKEFEASLSEIVSDMAEDVLYNERGTWTDATFKKGSSRLFSLHIPLWTQIDLSYRDGKVVLAVTLFGDWSDGTREIEMQDADHDEMTVLRAYQRVIEKELKLPVTDKVMLDGFDDLDYFADDLRDQIKRTLSYKTQKAADQIGRKFR